MKYGRYEVVKELGRGTMGVVYQAHDPQIDRMVALKVLRPDRVVSQDFVLRFLREAKAIGRISHPNIVTVYDVGQDRGTIYIAMEYLEGRPLNEAIKGRTLPPEEAVRMCSEVAEALGYAHGKGIIHRDIKPSNIILTPDQRTKLTDFGIARIEDPDAAQQTQAGDILGTPVYMAPEQVMGQRADARTDLYALGVILYEMVVGKRPFGGGNIAAIFRSITHEPPEDPMKAGAFHHRELADLILKSLSKDASCRFQTGQEMAAALKACLDKEAHPFPGPESTESAEKPVRFKKAGIVIAGLFICLAAGVIGYKAMQKPGEDTGTTAGAQLPVASSLLDVASTPSGAQVFVDSVLKGTTPVNIPLAPGSYEVRLNLPGFYEWEAQLQIGEDRPAPLDVRLVSID
jgi:serine/threonine protein kinase